jgi:hypothetical protein
MAVPDATPVVIVPVVLVVYVNVVAVGTAVIVYVPFNGANVEARPATTTLSPTA